MVALIFDNIKYTAYGSCKEGYIVVDSLFQYRSHIAYLELFSLVNYQTLDLIQPSKLYSACVFSNYVAVSECLIFVIGAPTIG